MLTVRGSSARPSRLVGNATAEEARATTGRAMLKIILPSAGGVRVLGWGVGRVGEVGEARRRGGEARCG